MNRGGKELEATDADKRVEDSWVDFGERGNRLLVVEGRLPRQKELANRFRCFGYSVAVAIGREDAIRILDTEPGFDFAIYDPEYMAESGSALAEHCAACSDLNQIKLVPLIGSRDTISDDVFSAVGVSGHMRDGEWDSFNRASN